MYLSISIYPSIHPESSRCLFAKLRILYTSKNGCSVETLGWSKWETLSFMNTLYYKEGQQGVWPTLYLLPEISAMGPEHVPKTTLDANPAT